MQAVLETGFVPVAAIDNEITNEDPVLRELELGEISGQCKSVVNDLDTMETACEALEELSDMSDILSKNNAIGSDAASLAAISSESICRRLGYVREKPIMPSMESFSYSNSRKQATEYTLESFGDVAKDVIEAIKTFFKKLVAGIMKVFGMIKNFILGILRKMGLLKSQVKQIYDDKKTDVESEREVDFSVFCTTFNVEKASQLNDKVTDVLNDSLNVSDALKRIHDTMTTFYNVALATKDVQGLINETTGESLDHKIFKLKVVEDNKDYATLGDFIHGKQIRVYKNEYKVEVVDGEKVTVSDSTMKVGKDLELLKLLDTAEKLAEAVEANVKRSEKNKEGFKDLTETVLKVAGKIATKARSTQENKEAAKVFRTVAQTTVSVTSSLLYLVSENLTESLKYIEFCKRELLVNAKENATKVT